MAISEKLGQAYSSLIDTLNEQSWFQELKGKWDELDPQSKTYLKLASIGGGVLLFLVITISSLWSVHGLKKELATKTDLLHLIQSANDELRRLKESNAGLAAAGGAAETAPWGAYLETVAGSAGIDKSALTVSAERPGSTSETSKESLFDLNVKHVNIKQVVRYAFNLESGSRPVKLRNLVIDTKADPSGYMDATLSVSAFSVTGK